jgi:hypothetical protein
MSSCQRALIPSLSSPIHAMVLFSKYSPSISVTAAVAFLPNSYAYSRNRTFEESCLAFASEVDIPNVKVHFSQYLPVGYNLSIPDFVCSQVPYDDCPLTIY